MAAGDHRLDGISDFVWGPPLLALPFGTHLYLTFRLPFIQRFPPTGIRLSFARRHEGPGDIPHFGTPASAPVATKGRGNIVGVSTAIARSPSPREPRYHVPLLSSVGTVETR